MAYDIALEVLTFQIRNARDVRDEAGKYYHLANIVDNDFFNFFSDFISFVDQSGLQKNEQYQKGIKFKSNTLKIDTKKRIIRGVFDSGNFGFESDIHKKDTIIKKLIEDVETMPFYFLIYIPKDSNLGFLMLQRFGNYGVSTMFKAHFNGFFKSKYPDMMIDYNQYVSKELAETFAKGGIKEVVLTRYNLPSDKAERMGFREYSNQIKSIELRIKAKAKTTFSDLKLKNFIRNSNGQFFSTRAIKELGFDGSHKISIISKYGNSQRTIDVSDTMNIKPYYVLDKVERETSKHPNFSSIDNEAIKLLDEFTSHQRIKN